MFAILMIAFLGLEPAAQQVMDALSEKGCPKIYGMLTPSFQQSVPAAKWPAFCDGIGALGEVTAAGEKNGWPVYHARAKSGEWEIGLQLNAGKISGLYVRPWHLPETARSLAEKLAQVGAAHDLPGMAALYMRDGKIVEQAAWGVRKAGDATRVEAGDRWHLGSDTKAMTATLAALVVADGKLSWQSTPASVFTDWKDLNPEIAKVTLEQLLEHRAGLAHETPKNIWSDLRAAKDPVAGRTAAAHALLKLPPNKIGEFNYANDGYVIVGAMLQRATGESWESLMQKRLFAPLGMSSCGFGPPATVGKIDSPWAHEGEGKKLTPIEPGPKSDNPPAIGPAGTAHCALADWAKFVEEHVRGERGEPTVLKIDAATFRRLHTPPAGGMYAFGWGVTTVPWAKGAIITHDGSNTMFYATVAASPKDDSVFLVATNAAGDPASRATHEVIHYLAEQLGKGASAPNATSATTQSGTQK